MDFKDFWYIAALSSELKPGKALSRKILGEWIVLFRDEAGRAVAMLDKCVHRNAQLSKGFVKKGCLTCPYHGWAYNGEGQVTHIPAEGPNPPKAKRMGKVFPVLEQQDFIYVRLNESPAEGLPPFQIPHYGETGWKTIRLINRFKNNVTNCVENFVDIPHTVFVHPGIFRVAKYQKFSATVTREDGRVFTRYANETSNLGWFSWFLNPKKQEIVHTDLFSMPNVTSVEYIFGPKRHFIITSQSIPVTEEETLVYTDLTYNYGIWNALSGPIVRFQAQKIIDQDIEILGNQGETIAKYGEKFTNTQSDVIHFFIESIRNELKKGADPRQLPKRSQDIEFWV